MGWKDILTINATHLRNETAQPVWPAPVTTIRICLYDHINVATLPVGHLVCWLPQGEVAALAKRSGFREWQLPGTDVGIPSYVRLPSEIDKAERRYGLAALAHAQASTDG
jgi:hypothetical protein